MIVTKLLLIDLVAAIRCYDLLASLDEPLGSLLDKILGDVHVPDMVDLVHQLLPRAGHWVREDKLLGQTDLICKIKYFILTFITPQMQKSRGARSGELGLQEVPPHLSDPKAKVLLPKED